MTDAPPYLRPFVLESADVAVETVGAVDLYRPEETARTGAILFVHGGPMPPGLEVLPREWPVYRGYGAAVAARGVVGAVVGHSLIRGFDRLADASDEVEAAIGVLRSDPRVDPGRVGLWFFSGAGLLAGEWLDSRPDWLRFVALTYPLLATPPGADELVSAAEVIGKHKNLPVLLTRVGREREELAGPVAEFVSVGGTALDIIDVPKGQHGFDMLDHDEESRAAVTAALDWAIAHLGEDPDSPTTPPIPTTRKPSTPTSTAAAGSGRATRRTAETTPAGAEATGPSGLTRTVSTVPAQPDPAEPRGSSGVTRTVSTVPAQLDPADLLHEAVGGVGSSGEAGPAGVLTAGLGPVAAETPAARVVGREHSAAAAHDLEAFLSLYLPTAQLQLADGTVLKGRRFLREHFRLRFEAGRGKTDVIQRLTLNDWVVEHAISYEESGAVPTLAVYRVEDGHIAEVRFLT